MKNVMADTQMRESIANSEDRVRLIDADRPPEEVWQDIQKVLREYIN